MSGAGARVVVVGGGLAGITAALDCALQGAQVTLLEVRRRVGGAAYSVTREGIEMDNGQHVFLRGCLAYRGLLERIGSTQLTNIQERLEIPVLAPGREPFVLRRSPLPAPLHLAPALVRYPRLSVRERAAAVRAALALMEIDGGELARDEVTFGRWLEAKGQSANAIGALWDLIALPTLNVPAREASLALAAFVFRVGLLSSRDAGDIGFHAGTLGQVISEPAARALERAGVEVRLGWRASGVRRAGSALEVLGRGGAPEAVPLAEQLAGDGASGEAAAGPRAGEADAVLADAVIVAVQHARAAAMLEEILGLPATAPWAGLGASPIVNLHVVYDREVCPHPFAAGVGSPVQYVFDRTRAAGAPAGSQYLAVSLSGAAKEMKLSVEQLRARYEPALAELLPAARSARMESFLVTREHAATFRAAPGVQALRPGVHTTEPGLLLAGTWTDTGWPATLESAVLSGHRAAAAALAGLGALAAPSPAGADEHGRHGATLSGAGVGAR